MKVVRAISAVVLALLVLVSSTRFVVGMHLCMDEIQNVALFSKADRCEKEQSQPPCHRDTKAPCCDDQTVINETDDFKSSVTHLHMVVPAQIDTDELLILVSEVIPSAPLSRVTYHRYDPPLRSCDLTVENQVFLI